MGVILKYSKNSTIFQNISLHFFQIPLKSRECVKWLRYYYVWMDGPFEYLEPKFVEETTENFYKKFMATQKYYRQKIKADLISNPICKFRVSILFT